MMDLDLDSLMALHDAAKPMTAGPSGFAGDVGGDPMMTIQGGPAAQPEHMNFMDRIKALPMMNVQHGFHGVDTQGNRLARLQGHYDRLSARFGEINAKRAERGLPPIGQNVLDHLQGRIDSFGGGSQALPTGPEQGAPVPGNTGVVPPQSAGQPGMVPPQGANFMDNSIFGKIGRFAGRVF